MLTLAAWGGGGGSSGTGPTADHAPKPLPAVTITKESIDALGESLNAAVDAVTDANGYVLAGAPADTARSLNRGTSAPAREPLGDLIQQLLALDAPTVQTTQATARHAGEAHGDACANGGTWTVTLTDRDGDNEYSVGDTKTFEFTACSGMFVGTTNGRVSVDLNAYAATVVNDGTRVFGTLIVDELDLHAVFTNLTIDERRGATITANGVVDMKFTQDGPGLHVDTVSTPSLTVSINDRTLILTDFSVTTTEYDTTSTVAYNGQVSDSAVGSYTVATTLAPFVSAKIEDPTSPVSVPATSGKVMFTGANSSLTVTVVNETLMQLELDNDGDGIADLTWTE